MPRPFTAGPLASFRELYREHHRWFSVAFFLLGFAFDTVMLQRIDEPKVILQQALYLIVTAVLIGVELVGVSREITPPRFLAKAWIYREALFSFMLGTLLNSHTIFYFKSASALASFTFIAVLVAVLAINEFKRFGKSQIQVHMGLWCLCLISYLVGLAPILMGFIGDIPFLGAILVSGVISAVYCRLLRSRLGAKVDLLRTHVVGPFAIVHVLFVVLYFAHVIPPVPLSVSYLGIFHDVEKLDSRYQLTYTRPEWRIWEHGDQTFLARPGDTLYCFARIYSPTRFSDQLQIRWLLWDAKRGWLPSDAIPVPILGGREEGFRTMTKKSNYQAGFWRVQIETMDNREVGRINFKVVSDPGLGERELRTILQ